MSWQILVALSVVLYSVSVLLQRVILKESNSKPIAYSIFYQFLIGIFMAVIALFFGGIHLPNLRPLIFNLILMALFYGFSNIFIFKSLKQTEASKFTIIFSTRAFFTIFASSLLLKEFLTTKQFIGVSFIFLGVILVNLKSRKFSLGRGEFFALLGAICFGLANSNDRYLLKHFELYSYMAVCFIVPSLVMSCIYHRELEHIKLFLSKKVLKKVLLLCIFYGSAALTFFAALQIGSNSSQIASINLSSVIITVLLSIIFLKEREIISKKLIAAIVSFIGLLLLGQQGRSSSNNYSSKTSTDFTVTGLTGVEPSPPGLTGAETILSTTSRPSITSPKIT